MRKGKSNCFYVQFVALMEMRINCVIKTKYSIDNTLVLRGLTGPQSVSVFGYFLLLKRVLFN